MGYLDSYTPQQKKKGAFAIGIAIVLIVLIIVIITVGIKRGWYKKKTSHFAPAPTPYGPAMPTNPRNRSTLI
jgi:flagellar basal body-associated protein FliL